MLVFKFTCDENHRLNTKLIIDRFNKAIGEKIKDVDIREGDNKVVLYIGKKSKDGITIPVEITDEDMEIIK